MASNIQLNEQQKQAVTDNSEVCLVCANVGSGKTTVLISKILYLHFQKNVPYSEMVVLTFTNKAAAEIKERLLAAEPNINQEDMRFFGTFHSVALELLRSELPVEKTGYTHNFQVIDPDEELELALRIIQEEKLSIKYKNRLKKRLETEKKAKYEDDLSVLRQILKERKQKLNKMSFHDLIESTVLLLEEHEKNPAWIIIDEVQDSDEEQYRLIKKMKGTTTKIFAVGDPNQVIYGWRGTVLNIFFQFKRDYSCTEVSLPINYRSSSSILQAAAVFQERGDRVTGIRKEGIPVRAREQYDAFQDAEYISERIQELHKEGALYKEIAVFYRLQNQSKVFQDVLGRKDIPYKLSVKKTLQDVPVLFWLVRLLRFALNPEDTASAEAVFMDKTYGQALTKKQAEKICQVLIGKEDRKKLKKDAEITAMELAGKCSHFRKSTYISSASQIYDYFRLDMYLHPTAASYKEDSEKCKRFLNQLETYKRAEEKDFYTKLEYQLNMALLEGSTEADEETDQVSLMTLHASKGLEFSHVFITGVNDGLIPLHTGNFDDMDEERRLFFVGMTRAKDTLELSWYINPDNPRIFPGSGRFLRSIPPEYLEMGEKQKTEHHLHDLRKMVEEEKQKNITSDSIQTEEQNSDPLSQESAARKTEPEKRKVSHPKYGIGEVISEDDMMIQVCFPDYGEKEFLKMFSELTPLFQ